MLNFNFMNFLYEIAVSALRLTLPIFSKLGREMNVSCPFHFPSALSSTHFDEASTANINAGIKDLNLLPECNTHYQPDPCATCNEVGSALSHS